MSIRQHMILDAQAHNRHLTDAYFDKKSNMQLLQHVHPLHREQFAKQLYNEGRISESQLNRIKAQVERWNKQSKQ